MTILNTRSNQSSTRRLGNANSFFRVQRGQLILSPAGPTATIPYIRGTSETIARIARSYSIRVVHKPIFTLRRLLTNVKGKDKPEDIPGAV